MAGSLRDAFREAVKNQPTTLSPTEKRKIEAEDYTDQGVRFIREKQRQGVEVFVIPATDWYNVVIHGLTRAQVREFEHYHLGGLVVIDASECARIISYKCMNGMQLEIIGKSPTAERNLITPQFIAAYLL